MPHLFVDCDDTLVLWSLHEDHKYTLNQPLIDAVNAFINDKPHYTLVVWSGGGVQYAHDWAMRCQFKKALIMPKYITTPKFPDIVVDDMFGDLKVGIGVDCLSPQQFIDKEY